MIRRDRAGKSAQVGQIAKDDIVVRIPVGRTADPLKVVDGIPKKRIARLRPGGTPSIVPHDDPDGLPGHGRYGAAY